jgi:hypothetical protein
MPSRDVAARVVGLFGMTACVCVAVAGVNSVESRKTDE